MNLKHAQYLLDEHGIEWEMVNGQLMAQDVGVDDSGAVVAYSVNLSRYSEAEIFRWLGY